MKAASLLVLLMAALQIAECKAKENEEESLLHYGIKISFWFILGVTIGVYFQARLNLKELMKPVIDVVLYGLLIAVAVFALFSFGELVEQYL